VERRRARPSARARPHLALVAAAFFFGTTFLVVKDAVSDAGPIPFLAARFCIGTLVLWPFARRTPATDGLWRDGAFVGAALLAGYVFQTVGLQYTSASESAFITYLLVAFVPLLSAVKLRRRPSAPTMAGVVLAVVGLWLLTGATPSLGRGELLTIGCSVAFAFHVVLLADHSPKHSAMRLNAVQLGVVGVACIVPGLFLGGYAFPLSTWLAAAFTGVFASAFALGMQVWAQARVEPSTSALVLTLEPVFAAVLGFVAGDRLGWVGVAGAALILAGVLVSELAPWPRARLQPEAPA
jgi:drug/metabolite transporter (DMT)-like permease